MIIIRIVYKSIVISRIMTDLDSVFRTLPMILNGNPAQTLFVKTVQGQYRYFLAFSGASNRSRRVILPSRRLSCRKLRHND
jgi:hypothetical protein